MDMISKSGFGEDFNVQRETDNAFVRAAKDFMNFTLANIVVVAFSKCFKLALIEPSSALPKHYDRSPVSAGKNPHQTRNKCIFLEAIGSHSGQAKR